MLVMGIQYHYALTNYGFSQGDIGKMMITFADTRSNLRVAIGYQDKTLVQETYEAYETKKQACKDYAATVEETVASAEERKLYDQIMSGMEDYFTSADKVVQMGKDVTNIDQRNRHSDWQKMKWHRSTKQFMIIWYSCWTPIPAKVTNWKII